ncbi:MAG: dihydrofolate reductase [Patescibacteria group bacterium]
MILSLIAAIGKNNELGKGNTLLFHLPADMKYFRDKTRGHSVIMGRKTFESLPGGPLPKRRNIVITRDVSYVRDGIEVVHSLEDAIEKVKTEELVYIIGGAEIYKQSMEFATRLDITHVNAEDKEADAFFPAILPTIWKEISHEENPKDSENPFDYIFSVYEKI